MNKYPRTGIVAAATALLAAPLPASADVGHIDDKPGDGPPWWANVTAVRVFHHQNRISATLRIPVVVTRRLARTQLKIQPKGSRAVWTVTIARDRRGKVTGKRLTVKRPGMPPGIVAGCDRTIRTGTGIEKTYVSVARRCLVHASSDRKIRAKARIVARHRPHRIVDRTPYTEYLARG